MMRLGLVQVANNDQIDEMERKAAGADEAEKQKDLFESSLAGYVNRCWQTAWNHKRNAEDRILKNLRQRNGIYDPAKLAEIKEQNAPELFMMLTAVKCRTAKAWIRDVMMTAGENPFKLEPSPVPDLPGDMEVEFQKRLFEGVQKVYAQGGTLDRDTLLDVEARLRGKLKDELERKAKRAAKRLQDKVEDRLAEGGWSSALDEFISDFVDFPAAIMRAPITRNKEKLTWRNGKAEVERKLIDEFYRVDPIDFFPMPGVVEIEDGGCFERHRLTRRSLYDMIGVQGYREKAIREVLQEYRNGGLRSWTDNAARSEQAVANKDDPSAFWEDDRIEALEFYDNIPGSQLKGYGITNIDDEERDYAACVWLVGRHVIYAKINASPMGMKPWSKACFENIPGSFWGNGVPDLITDCQDVCNASARSVVVNMGLASGPQVLVDVGSLPAGHDITSIFPWKIWQMSYKTGETRLPVEFYQPNPMVDALLKVYNHFSRLADDHSGIPAYTYGSADLGGAARTSSGLAMLMNAASKTIKNGIAHIDVGVIETAIMRVVMNILLYEATPDISGDINVIARGAMNLLQKEQAQMRRIEFLAQTANPFDMEIMGLQGRAAVLREVSRSLDMDAESVVPDEEEMAQRQANLAIQQATQGSPIASQQQTMPSRPQPSHAPRISGPQIPRPPRPRVMDAAGRPAGGVDNRTMR